MAKTKMYETKALAQEIWGANATKVMEFFAENGLSIKEEFREKKTLQNYIAERLLPYCRRMIDRKKIGSFGFWKCWMNSIRSNVEQKHQAKNILFVIRLLTGEISVPCFEEEKDRDELLDKWCKAFETRNDKLLKELEPCLLARDTDSFFENAEMNRESWYY